MKTKQDVSYGIIPIRPKGNSWEVFLIHQFSRIGNNSYWILPKGHPEEGETPRQTAERELKEETGLDVERFLTEPTFTVAYSFVHDGEKIEKRVTFFIGVIGTNVTPVLDMQEVKEAGWYPLASVIDRLDYRDTKEMFVEAKRFIESL